MEACRQFKFGGNVPHVTGSTNFEAKKERQRSPDIAELEHEVWHNWRMDDRTVFILFPVRNSVQ